MKQFFFKFLALVIFCAIMVSCNEKKQNLMQEVIVLEGKPILEDLYSAISLHFVDSLLLVRLHNQNQFFNVYDRGGNYLGAIGKRGAGPGEWSAICTSGQVQPLEIGNGLYLTERSKSELFLIDLQQSISSSGPVILNEITIPTDFMLDNYLVLSDSSIIGSYQNMRCEHLLAKVSIKDSCIVKESTSAFSIAHLNQLSATLLNTLFLTFSTIKPSRDRIASAYSYFDRIDIYCSDLTLFKSISLSTFPTQIDGKILRREIENEQNDNHYHGICSTDKYIYALYRKEKEIDYGEKTDIGSEIRVFDWNGELIHRYSVSDYLMSIAVDEEMGVVYGLDYYNEKLFKYLWAKD